MLRAPRSPPPVLRPARRARRGGHARGRSSRATCRPARARTEREDDPRPGHRVHAQVSTVDVQFDGCHGQRPDGVGRRVRIGLPAPFQRQGERAVHRDGAEQAPHATSTSVTRVTNLARDGQPRRRVPGSGPLPRPRLHAGRPVFAHYLFGGKEQRTVRLARRSTAPCGMFSVKRRQIPSRRRAPAAGSADRPAAQVLAGAGPGVGPASDRRHAGRALGDRGLRRARARERQLAVGRVDLDRSPAANSPLSSPSASGSTSRLEITRLSGRAP